MKYLGVKIDENLNWKDQTYDIVTELKRPNVLLYKIGNYLSFNTLKGIYFTSLIHILIMQTLYRGKTRISSFIFLQKLLLYRKKLLRIINNHPRNSHSGPLSKKSNILKLEDKILISNIYNNDK